MSRFRYLFWTFWAHVLDRVLAALALVAANQDKKRVQDDG